MTASDSVISL